MIRHVVVEELATLRATVYTCSRNEAEINECLKDWKSKGVQFAGSACNKCILINDIRTNTLKSTMDYTTENFPFLLTTNFELAYHLSQLGHPLLKASGAGSIVLLSSICGVVSMNIGSINSATKSMNRLTKNLACEWAKENIRSNYFALRTEPLFNNEKFHKEVIARTPIGRAGEPMKVPSLVGFLSMPVASYI
ncbi:hypothetical protein EUGRSUZ_J02007 [Eucalyptus grandis]|uniref:Uncharacterized protein n=2 Tax=Eucalyptus grandis TaxID=71139 RepID=A0A059AGW9_EUCGR|nr:hypothetical protein EUGRSUZ_J02007 [Eucalyptus grandis]